MSNTGNLSDKDKIDRAAQHEELRFYKKQQWAVAAAGMLLSGGFLAAVRNIHLTPLDRFFAVILIFTGVGAGWYVLESLQTGITDVRRSLDAYDYDANVRGREIMYLYRFILGASAVVLLWAVLFKLP